MSNDPIPATLLERRALPFWIAVILTGIGTGLAAAALTRLLEIVQRLSWSGTGQNLLEAVLQTTAYQRVGILAGAGVVTGLGQFLLRKLTSGNGIDISEAIWFRAGRLPAWRTLGSAVLSNIIVGMGVSLGREGAPKQAGAVFANTLSDLQNLSDEQRRLLVACGAGAGMAAAYGVPLGGALFAIEVLRGVLALRLILPALVTSVIATVVSWIALPNRITYELPSYPLSTSIIVWAIVAGPLIGLFSVGYVRLIAFADHHKPEGLPRFVVPIVVLSLIGAISIWFPQILGNGKDIAQLAFVGQVAPLLLLALLFLKPFATAASLGSGAPGGLFTPSLAFGALLGGVLGFAWSLLWPGVPPGFFALIGAAAMLAATTQGPISATVLIMELTNHDRSFIVPAIFAVATATLVARTIEPRSIYDSRLNDEEIEARLKSRAQI